MSVIIDGIKKLNKRFDVIKREHKCTKLSLWCSAFCDFIRYGVTPNEFTTFTFYEKKHIVKKTYYTARYQNKIEKMFNAEKNAEYFNDKSKFNESFSEFVKRKWLYCTDKTDKSEIEEFVNGAYEIMVKPTGLSSGRGIYKLDKTECDVEKLRGCLLEERVYNHKEIQRLSPGALCTVRMYTVLDRKGDLHYLGTFLRMGGKKDAVVDNYHSGGLYARIDTPTGIIVTKGKTIEGKLTDVHPLSGVYFIGFKMPLWDQVIETVEKAARIFPESRFIGWDIAILDDRVELIEGNYVADPGFMQSLDNGGKLYELKELY